MVTAASTGSTAASVGKAPERFGYRPDIDALRGVAMLAVLVFHLNKGWLPGGFTGVDIFFVISGYVVTGSLLSHGSQALLPRLGNFYLRRVRRLLPNLLVCIGVTSLGVAMLVPPGESRPYLMTAVKAVFGWSNNYLKGQIDYFNPDADLNPFLHTWSLGVEQQFYLVFPLLMVGIGYGVRRSLPLLAALTVLSLGASWWWTQSAPMAAFFLMPSRLWELTSGALLLVAQRRGLLGAAWLKGRWPRLVGALLLVWAVVMTSEREGFPLPGVLPAVVGTLLVLQAGPGEGGRFLPGRWLERVLLTCGLLSYSLYLWHWPVIVLLRWTWGMETWWQYGLAVAGSVVLGVAAYGLVEQPVRRHPLKWWWEVALTVLALAGVWLGIDALQHSMRGRFFIGTDRDPVPQQERMQNLVIPGTGIGSGCSLVYGQPYNSSTRIDFERCGRPGRPGAGEIFLLGDSHALHLLPMLDDVTAATGQRLSFTYQMACFIDPTMLMSWGNKSYGPCRQFAAGEMERSLQRLRRGDIVVIAAWLNYYLSDITPEGKPSDATVMEGKRRLTASEARTRHVANLRRYAEQLAARGIQLVLVVDTPMLARKPVECRRVIGKQVSCAPPAPVTTRMQAQVRDTMAAVAAGLPNVHVFDPTPYLVETDGRVRYRKPDGTPLYADNHHLSVSGSRSLAEPFRQFLTEAGLVPAAR